MTMARSLAAAIALLALLAAPCGAQQPSSFEAHTEANGSSSHGTFQFIAVVR